jgi:hypothetical protein
MSRAKIDAQQRSGNRQTAKQQNSFVNFYCLQVIF